MRYGNGLEKQGILRYKGNSVEFIYDRLVHDEI